MPAFIAGPIQINTISDGIVKYGDSLFNSPKSASKTPAGSGNFNTAFVAVTNTLTSNTNFIDPDLVDQPTAGNN